MTQLLGLALGLSPDDAGSRCADASAPTPLLAVGGVGPACREGSTRMSTEHVKLKSRYLRRAQTVGSRGARCWSAARASPASRPRSTWPIRVSRSTSWSRRPAIGGRMALLDKTFPTGDCAMCIISPKLVECGRNKNIEIITLADVEKHQRRGRQLPGRDPPAPALRGFQPLQRLRRLCRGLPRDAAERVRPRAGQAQSDLPALSAGDPQRLRHRQGRRAARRARPPAPLA